MAKAVISHRKPKENTNENIETAERKLGNNQYQQKMKSYVMKINEKLKKAINNQQYNQWHERKCNTM
jgi:hypothetical protein